MPHLDRFAMSELASESEPLQDFSEEQGARLSAERAMRQRDVREARAGGRGVRRPGALLPDDDGACRPRRRKIALRLRTLRCGARLARRRRAAARRFRDPSSRFPPLCPAR